MTLSKKLRDVLARSIGSRRAANEICDIIDAGSSGETVSAYSRNKLAAAIGRSRANSFINSVQTGDEMSTFARMGLILGTTDRFVADQLAAGIAEYSGLVASYLDGSTPYHTGPTGNRYFVRDVSGNGRHAPIKTPCLTGGASSTAFCSIGTHSLTGDFEYEFWTKYEGSATTTSGPMFLGGGLLAGGATATNYLWYRPSTGIWTVAADGDSIRLTVTNTTLEDNLWHKIKVTRAGTTYRLFIDDVQIASNVSTVTTITLRQIMNTYANQHSVHGQMADFRLTYGGVTYYFPLQDGPGSTNTNRNIAWVASNGTGGVISNALTNGTVTGWWSTFCPGYAQDWSIEYGGKLGAGGEFIAGMLSGGNAADGTAKTLTAGKLGNPFTSLNLNPNWSTSLIYRGFPTEYKAGQNINGQIVPAESAFRRTAASGDDRILLYSGSKSGSVLTDVRTHTGETAQPTWTIAELPDDTADEYFAQITANSGTISANNQTAVRNLLQGLYDDNLYRRVLALYLFHGNHLNAARLNAINPGTHPGSWAIVWVGSPTLNASGGITPSTGNYGKAFQPDSMGLSLRSGAGMGFHSTSNAASSEQTMGVESLFFLSPKISGNAKAAIGGFEVSAAVQDLSGFHFASREPDSNVQALYRNGTQYLTNSTQGWPQLGYVTTPELAFIGGRRGTVNAFSTTPIRLAIVTEGLTSTQVSALSARVSTYIGALI